MIKKTGLKINDQNLQRATQELKEIDSEESETIGLGTIDSDKTYSDINNLTNVASENTFHHFKESKSDFGLNLNFDNLETDAFKNFPENIEKLGDKTFNTLNTQNMTKDMSKDLDFSKIEKMNSEVGNSTISHVYNLALAEDKENHFTANSKKEISIHDQFKQNTFRNQALCNEVNMTQDSSQNQQHYHQVHQMRKIQSNLQGNESGNSMNYLKTKHNSFQVSPNQHMKMQQERIMTSSQGITNSNCTLESHVMLANMSRKLDSGVLLKHPASECNFNELNEQFEKSSNPSSKNFNRKNAGVQQIHRMEHFNQINANDSISSQLSFGFQKNPSKNNYYNKQAVRVKERVIDGKQLEQYISMSSLGVRQNIDIEKQIQMYHQQQQH